MGPSVPHGHRPSTLVYSPVEFISYLAMSPGNDDADIAAIRGHPIEGILQGIYRANAGKSEVHHIAVAKTIRAVADRASCCSTIPTA